jgi:DNA (cytosine-5)-methyltransferase 1
VASDTNDFVTPVQIVADSIADFRSGFLSQVYETGRYRKITKSEACRIQGFPDSFLLPDTRQRWMKLIGNSVAVPVIKVLAKAIVETGVFDDNGFITKEEILQIQFSRQQNAIKKTYNKQGIQTELFQIV